jgi:hypothetical protein
MQELMPVAAQFIRSNEESGGSLFHHIFTYCQYKSVDNPVTAKQQNNREA